MESFIYPGNVSPEHFEYLIVLSGIRGKKIISALESFLVKGVPRKDLFKIYGISPGYFSLKLKQVRYYNSIIVGILPFYTK
ncbi:TPA: PapB/FocB family fimbrial expression transcriptional regulator [Citrobacter freundii]